ncbi:MAG: hypothetical protein Q8Q88_19555 [Phenylobacterium sp.]|uniref:hypothetical protein n=1 Tax=Phenylobacterium sp. TaxID=1871053 RepID=UPI002732BF38|nr:hypothetical protein [Phenylobacterium sp.]MDP3749238.1 hypothetical protein [Phenylobacterium sp.]
MAFKAAHAVRNVLIAGFLLMLGANLPGHLSVDSIMQLYEGRMQVRETFAPAIYAMILRVFDEIIPGTGLYVVASGFLLFASLASLCNLRPGVSWFAVPVALAVVLSPALLVYQGIVWRDVLFANVAVAGFVCLAHAARHWEVRQARWFPLLGALVLLALAAIVRQNGLIVVALAALALGWVAWPSGWRAGLAWGGGGFLAVVILSQVLAFAAQPKSAGPDMAIGVGIRILQHYDIVGSVAHDRSLALSRIDAANSTSDDLIRAEAPKVYSPERVDFLDRAPALGANLWPLSNETVGAEWRDIIIHHPGAYLAHRWDAFRWVFFTPAIERCVPVHVGVDGPAVKLKALDLAPGVDSADRLLYSYSARFFATPVFSHLAYALTAIVVSVLLILRRENQDIVIVALLLSSLVFTASFFIISLACDYRYLYFLDLSAIAGLLYLTIDPSLVRARAQAGVGAHP